jgi:serine protease Do
MAQAGAGVRYTRTTRSTVAALASGVALIGVAGGSVPGGSTAAPRLPWARNDEALVAVTQSNRDALSSFPEIIDQVKSSVLGVRTRVMANPGEAQRLPSPADPRTDRPRQFGAPKNAPQDQGAPDQQMFRLTQGSGFFISEDGYAVTNSHVVGENKTAEVETEDGKTYTAKVVGIDPLSDLALIKVEGNHGFAPAKFADKTPRVGEWVLAIGNPFGLGGTVTAGIVSAVDRSVGNSYQDLVQIDAPVNQGNSGGPTFDLDGNVIGVNTMIVSPSGGSIGIAFAIPIDTLKTVIPQLKEKGYVTRGWLGVRIAPVAPDSGGNPGPEGVGGATITEAQANGPAAKAGLTSGDVVTSIDGEPVKDAHDLATKIAKMSPGAAVKLDVRRNGEHIVVAATLGELPVQRLPRTGMREPG